MNSKAQGNKTSALSGELPEQKSAGVERVAEIEAYIQAQSTTIVMASKARQDSLNEWAALVSPWRVGDITNGQGYTFTGKQVRVTEVRGTLRWDRNPTVFINAVVLTNLGTDGKKFTEWYWHPPKPTVPAGFVSGQSQENVEVK